MTAEEKRAKHAEYMREYSRKNADRINAQKRERALDPARKAKKHLQVVPALWNQSKSNKHCGEFFPRGVSRS